MSTVTATSETYTATGTPLPGMKQFGMIAGVLGVVLAVRRLLACRALDRFFQAYLVAYTFWMGVVLGSMALLMVQHLSGGVWGIVLRRPFEAAVRTIPFMAVLFVPIAVRHALALRVDRTRGDHQTDPVICDQVALPEHAVLLRPPGVLLRRLGRSSATC